MKDILFQYFNSHIQSKRISDKHENIHYLLITRSESNKVPISSKTEISSKTFKKIEKNSNTFL